MEKITKSEFYEVWFSNGKTYWDYDLKKVISFIRENSKVTEKLSCVLMWRRDFTNSVVVQMLRWHELKFNY